MDQYERSILSLPRKHLCWKECDRNLLHSESQRLGAIHKRALLRHTDCTAPHVAEEEEDEEAAGNLKEVVEEEDITPVM